jgi:hypothetical protein
MLQRLFPKQIDNRFEGHRLALWLLGIHVGLRAMIGLNSIANTAKVAGGADGYRLADYGADGARAVLMLFSLSGLAGLTMALLGVIVLLRYRAMAPLLLMLLLFDFLARRMIIQSYAVERSGSLGFAWWLNSALLAMLALGLALSLWPSRQKPRPTGPKP